MITTILPCTPTLQELMAWCDLACDTYASTVTPDDTQGTRQLKRHLSRLHLRHLNQLRELAGRGRIEAKTQLHPRLWQDLLATMRTPDEDVVVGACGLLERSLIAAYLRAEATSLIAPAVRRVIHLQLLDLKCSYSYYLRRMPWWRQRLRASAPAKHAEPAVGTLIPAMA